MTRHLLQAAAFAALLLAGATALRYAQNSGILAVGDARQITQILLGLALAAYANFMPKRVGGWPSSPRAAQQAQAVLRFGGWALTLAGLAYAGLWAFAPLEIADVAATAIVAGATIATFIVAARAFATCRSARLRGA